jgi:hypothetical protein
MKPTVTIRVLRAVPTIATRVVRAVPTMTVRPKGGA